MDHGWMMTTQLDFVKQKGNREKRNRTSDSKLIDKHDLLQGRSVDLSDFFQLHLTRRKMTYLCTNIRSWILFTSTVKSQFNESRFNVKSRFREWNFVTKMEFHIKKSRFRVKSRCKEWKGADGGHSLNRDFTAFVIFEIHSACWDEKSFLCDHKVFYLWCVETKVFCLIWSYSFQSLRFPTFHLLLHYSDVSYFSLSAHSGDFTQKLFDVRFL